MDASGFSVYFYRYERGTFGTFCDYEEKKRADYRTEGGVEPMSLFAMQSVFFVLTAGIAVSSLAFVIELLSFYCFDRKKKVIFTGPLRL